MELNSCIIADNNVNMEYVKKAVYVFVEACYIFLNKPMVS
jgi:hypothetical protein